MSLTVSCLLWITGIHFFHLSLCSYSFIVLNKDSPEVEVKPVSGHVRNSWVLELSLVILHQFSQWMHRLVALWGSATELLKSSIIAVRQHFGTRMKRKDLWRGWAAHRLCMGEGSQIFSGHNSSTLEPQPASSLWFWSAEENREGRKKR